MQVNMHKAKTQLSALAKRARSGERVILAKDGEPWVELIPFQSKGVKRAPGGLKGRIWIAPGFDATPEDVVRTFEGAD